MLNNSKHINYIRWEGVVGHKIKFVLSDLHIGAGHANEGGNYREDFVADDLFIAFLQQIVEEGEQYHANVELIINGDFLEFLQVPPVTDFKPTKVYP